jgi:hypothetical protein
MADDNTARYRSNEPYSRGPAAAAPANDPLAELARLIGQSDPFSEARREPRPAEQSMGASFGPAPAPSYPSSAAPTYDEPQRYAPEPVPPPYEPTSQYDPTTPRYAADYPPQGYAESQPAHQNWPGSPPFYPHTPQHDPFSLPQRNAPQLGGQRHDTPYADPHARGIDLEPHLPGFDPPYQQRPRSGFSQPLYPQEPEAGSMPPPHDDEFYDDTPPGGRRKGLLTVVAVFGLAVVGTAGAFGYRSLFNGPGPSGPPPVIRASGEPSKVAPPPQAPEQSASKFSYDRFGDAGKDERVVRREEKPVDIARPATQTPRSVFPSVPMSANTSAKPGAAMASANPPSALGEPRKVRTVPIRPDQGDVAANSPVASEPVSIAPPRQVNPPPLPSRSTDAVPVAATLPVAARAAAPRSAAARIATHPAASSPAPASLANAPLSLAPDASNDFPPPPSAPPPRAAAAPVRVASAPSSGGGSFLVQVTSQRSEADAQSSYRSIQQKYASVLGSQPHVVRKADLGSKGVYYRAMVGPFSSREQAVQLCSSLKQAGGDCVVQH